VTVGDKDGSRVAAPCRIRFDADLPSLDRSCLPPAVAVHLPVRPRNSWYFQRADHSFSRISQVVLWKPRLTLSIVVSSQPSCRPGGNRDRERTLPQLQPPAFTASSGHRFRFGISPPFAGCRQGRGTHIRWHIANPSGCAIVDGFAWKMETFNCCPKQAGLQVILISIWFS